jgi:amino acid permease
MEFHSLERLPLPVVSPVLPSCEMSHSPDYDIEKKATNSAEIVTADVVPHEDTGHMHRSLKGRQISMIAIAGTIGTGCTTFFLCASLF